MVTDEGIALLLASEGKFVKTLSSLDIGDLPKAITTIVKSCVGLTELCIRCCDQVTDASVMALALKGTQVEGESKLVRKLDLCDCRRLSIGLLELLKKPLFPGLLWIGIKDTTLNATSCEQFADIVRGRRRLTVCPIGCEMGCRQGWEFH